MSARGEGAGIVPSRETRRMLLPLLGAGVVAAYLLAPFCWLLLTSFMHEQDALAVPRVSGNGPL